jgi:hypothetical protein
LAAAHATIAELRGWVGQLRGAETAALEAELRQLRAAAEQSRNEYSALGASHQQLTAEIEACRSQLVETRELALLQEVGVYEYAHPLDDALAYKDALNALKQQIKAAAKGDAVTCQVDWAVNGSVKEGQKLGRDMAKLMLRAYNAEADNAVRVVKPHTREAVKKRLTTMRDTIGKLGVLMRIAISEDYHQLRLHEIDLTADYLVKVEAERDEARAERERLREEAKVMKEIERERARLAKERAHYATVVAKLEANGDLDVLARAQEQLASVDGAIAGVDQRAANVRAGYVYVISNVGAFGPDVVKIGMTRPARPDGPGPGAPRRVGAVPVRHPRPVLLRERGRVGDRPPSAAEPQAGEPGQPASRVLLRHPGRGQGPLGRPGQRPRPGVQRHRGGRRVASLRSRSARCPRHGGTVHGAASGSRAVGRRGAHRRRRGRGPVRRRW